MRDARPADNSGHRCRPHHLSDYRAAWLAGDSARILGHISDSIMLFVPGTTARTLHGKSELVPFWFPGGDSTYPIRRYDISDEVITGGGDWAIARGRSTLGWETAIRDSVVASATTNSEYLMTLRREKGEWKLYHDMYVLRN